MSSWTGVQTSKRVARREQSVLVLVDSFDGHDDAVEDLDDTLSIHSHMRTPTHKAIVEPNYGFHVIPLTLLNGIVDDVDGSSQVCTEVGLVLDVLFHAFHLCILALLSR